MPRVGKYELPVITVDDALTRLRKVREVAGGRSVARDVAAEAMGMSAKGGQTQYIFSSMAGYGLIDTGGKEVRVTDLGETALFGDTNEVQAAKSEAVMHVNLLRDIYSKYGTSPSEEQVRAFLRQDAQVELARIPKMLERVTKLLRLMSQYAATNAPVQSAGTGKRMGRQDVTAPLGRVGPMDENTMEVRIGSYQFTLPLDDLNLAASLAKNNIDGIISSLKTRKVQSGKETTGAETS